MKINLKHLALITVTGLLLGACDDGDKVIDEIFDTTTRGAILRTVELTGSDYDRFDTSTVFGFEVEAQDVENGKLLEKMDIYVNFTDKTSANGTDEPAEAFIKSVPASEFSDGPYGLPRTSFESTFADALSALGLVEGDFDGGDVIFFRLELTLTDGRVFTNTGNTGTLSGSFLASPFQYNRTIKCIPPSPVAGQYSIVLNDSYGDGWNGAAINVTIDGTTTPITLADGSTSTETFTVPDGTTEFIMEFVSGDWDSEVDYEVTAPTGENAISDGPSPTTGVLVLNICNG